MMQDDNPQKLSTKECAIDELVGWYWPITDIVVLAVICANTETFFDAQDD